MSCFDIMHRKEGLEIWPIRSPNHRKGPEEGPMRTHPVVQELRVFHGKSARKGSNKVARQTSDPVDTYDEDDEDKTTTCFQQPISA
jgi:hypothetical protein